MENVIDLLKTVLIIWVTAGVVGIIAMIYVIKNNNRFLKRKKCVQLGHIQNYDKKRYKTYKFTDEGGNISQ